MVNQEMVDRFVQAAKWTHFKDKYDEAKGSEEDPQLWFESCMEEVRACEVPQYVKDIKLAFMNECAVLDFSDANQEQMEQVCQTLENNEIHERCEGVKFINLTEEDIQSLQQPLKANTSMKTIDFGECEATKDCLPIIIDILKENANVQNFVVPIITAEEPINDEFIELAAILRDNQSLYSLNIFPSDTCASMTEDALSAFGDCLKDNSALTTLQVPSVFGMIGGLTENTSLKSLTCRCARGFESDVNSENLGKLMATNASLETLALQGGICMYKDPKPVIEALNASEQCGLTSLEFRNYNVYDADVMNLITFLKTSRVKELKLVDNKITDEGSQVLCEFVASTGISFIIDLSDNNLTDAGAKCWVDALNENMSFKINLTANTFTEEMQEQLLKEDRITFGQEED